MPEAMTVRPPFDTVPGDATGLDIPAHAKALLAMGPDFLTRAFRTYGTLPPEGSVVAITRGSHFAGGNSGHKLTLSVNYAGMETGADLPRELFVKFSRDFADPFRDRRRHELEAEVRLADLSRHPAFPVACPRACFADFHRESGTGLVIMAAIPFGRAPILPLRAKAMDHLLPDALDHYRAVITALADLAAAHRSGAIEPEASRLFPFDRTAALAELPVKGGAEALAARLAAFDRLATTCPDLLPAELAEAGFRAGVARDSQLFLAHERQVRDFLLADPDLIALAHWNGHLDNAWFWRDEAGALRCGLMDWGMARQMNLGLSLWGALSGAEPDMLDAHLDGLLDLFARRLAESGGPTIDRARLDRHFDMALMLLGQAMMLDGPALLLSRLAEPEAARSPRDPAVLADGVAHGFLHVFINFLHLWRRRDLGGRLREVLGAG